MSRQYVSVTLTARVFGDVFVLLDANGKKVGVVCAENACVASNKTIAEIETRHEWRNSFKQMLACNAHRHSYSQATAWDRKIGNWLASARFRRNRPDECRQSHKRRFSRWIEKRPNWEASICLMFRRNDAVIHKSRARALSPWRVWTETVAANIKARRKRHEDNVTQRQADATRSSAETARSGLQVRFDWSCFDASDSMA